MGKLIALAAVLAGLGCGKVEGPEDDGDDGDGEPGSLEVVSIEPADGATDVAVDAVIRVVFSGSIEAESVTAETFAVSGAAGAVAGELEVDGDTVTFTPAGRLHLLGTYDLALTTGIAGEEATLAETVEASFRVVDGAWSEPIDLADDVGEFPDFASNRRGDFVIPYGTNATPRSIKALRFDAVEASFSLPELVENEEQAFAAPNAAVNESGDVIVTWRTEPAGSRGWARRGEEAWETAVAPGFQGQVGLTADGTAVIASFGGNSQDVVVETLARGAGAWTAGETAFALGRLWSVSQSDDRVELVAVDDTAQQLLARGYTQGAGLSPVQNLSTTGIQTNWVQFEYLPGQDLVFSWSQDATEIWYATFDGDSDTWTSAVLGNGDLGSAVCSNPAGARIAAFVGGGSIFAVAAAAGEEFAAAANLGSPTGIEYARCVIDEWGNGHVIWAGYGTTRSFVARFVDGEFSQVVELDDGPTLIGVVADQATGTIRAIYYGGSSLQVRTFE